MAPRGSATDRPLLQGPWVESPCVADQVIIRIPASTPHIGLVRAAASALAALHDFGYDQITDLHIAIDEVCSRIIATSSPRPSRLELSFLMRGSVIRVRAAGDTPLKPESEFLTTWSRAILEAVATELEVIGEDGVACAAFEVAKG